MSRRICLLAVLCAHFILASAVHSAPIMAAGYWDTTLFASQGGHLTLLAVAPGATNNLEVGFQGSGLGVYLTDDGQGGDAAAGDGVYTFVLDLPPTVPLKAALEIMDGGGAAWPFLVVEDQPTPTPTATETPTPAPVSPRFDLEALDSDFYAIPFPNDLRKTQSGEIDLSAFPNPRNNEPMNVILQEAGNGRTGWCQNPVCFFAFDGNINVADLPGSGAASLDGNASVWLVDVQPDSPEYGRRLPLKLYWWANRDSYVNQPLLAVEPYPGVTLRQDTAYSCILWKGIQDQLGREMEPPLAFTRVLSGQEIGSVEGTASEVYAPLRDYLTDLALDSEKVLAATVFTTWHGPSRLKSRYDQAKARFTADLNMPFAFLTEFPEYYVLKGSIDLPQFQSGLPPFDSGGVVQFDANGQLVEMRRERAFVVLTIPKSPMPVGGFPLTIFVHGSGGLSTQAYTRSRWEGPGYPHVEGEGPALYLARAAIASACMSMPVNPERLLGASDYAYLNFVNLPSFPGNFQQGTLELGLLIQFLQNVTLDGSLVPLAAPERQTVSFQPEKMFGMGQSMGAMYLNLWASVEPGLKAIAPSGSGGLWSIAVMDMRTLPAKFLVNTVFGINNDQLNELHPAMTIFQMAIEPVDPIITVPHIFRDPLPGLEPKPAFYPAGYIDHYFSPDSISALALAYGFDVAGPLVDSTLVENLALVGRSHLDYPVTANIASRDGQNVTGVIVQYQEDGIMDGHYIMFQRTEPKYQYRCFFNSFLESGTPTVYAPGGLEAPCP